jgi:hypothetical protein
MVGDEGAESGRIGEALWGKMMEAMLLIMSGLFMITGLGVVIYRTLQR